MTTARTHSARPADLFLASSSSDRCWWPDNCTPRPTVDGYSWPQIETQTHVNTTTVFNCRLIYRVGRVHSRHHCCLLPPCPPQARGLLGKVHREAVVTARPSPNLQAHDARHQLPCQPHHPSDIRRQFTLGAAAQVLAQSRMEREQLAPMLANVLHQKDLMTWPLDRSIQQ